jgi:hypothetical protein
MSSKLENVPLFADSSSVGAKPASGAAAPSSSGQKATLEDIPLNSEVSSRVLVACRLNHSRWALWAEIRCRTHVTPACTVTPTQHTLIEACLLCLLLSGFHTLLPSLPSHSWAWTTATCVTTCQPVTCARPTMRRAPCS